MNRPLGIRAAFLALLLSLATVGAASAQAVDVIGRELAGKALGNISPYTAFARTYGSPTAAMTYLSGQGGGTLDLNGLQGSTLGAFTVPNVPAQLQFGVGTYTFSAAITNNQNRNMSILGSGHGTKLVTGYAGNLISWTGSQAGLAGSRLTEISRVWLEGNNTGLAGGSFPDNETNSLFDGLTVLDRNFVEGFTTAGVYFGHSNYMSMSLFNEYKDNGIGLWAGKNADTNVLYSVFTYPRDNAMLQLDSVQDRVVGNVFDRGTNGTGSTGLGPDIRLSDGATANIGATWIEGNKHGSEGETSGRVKILVQGSVSTATNSYSRFLHDWFYGLQGGNQTAYDFEAAPADVLIDGNHFQDIGLIVKDVPVATGVEIGGSVFTDTNTVQNSNLATPQGTQLFQNGGFGFYQVKAPPNLAHINAPNALAGPMQNRAPNPVNISAWGATNVSFTSGQTDPFGGTDGYLLTKTAAQSANASTGFSVTALLDDMGQASSGRNGRVVIGLWMKAGSFNTVMLRGGDGTFGGFFLKQFSLSNAWKFYQFELTGIDASHAPSLGVYPGGVSANTSGSIYVAHLSVSDFGSEFVPYQVLSQPTSLPRRLIMTASLTPTAVAAASVSVQRFAFTGARVGDIVTVNSPSAGQTANISLGQALVAANDNVDVSFTNPTAGSLTPAAGTYQVALTRPAQ